MSTERCPVCHNPMLIGSWRTVDVGHRAVARELPRKHGELCAPCAKSLRESREPVWAWAARRARWSLIRRLERFIRSAVTPGWIQQQLRDLEGLEETRYGTPRSSE